MITNLASDVLNPKKELKKSLSFDSASFVISRALRSRSIARRTILLYKERKLIKESEQYKQKMKELESKPLKLAPQVEGRSILIKNQIVMVQNL